MTKTLECALGLSALLALAGCYNTNNLKNGGLVCGKDSSCPDGFACKNDGPVGSAGHCWKSGTAPDAAVACTARPGYGPFCTADPPTSIPSSTCNPICQSGCACNRRCVLDDTTYTSFVCEASTPPAGTVFVQPFGACNGSDVDLCAPGSVCTNDDLCQNLCYKTCRTDQDCGGTSRCTASGIEISSTPTAQYLNFCSPPIETCDPTGTATCGTARTGFNCVFLAGLIGDATTDNTVCDCSSLHDKVIGQACALLPDDCRPGLVCVGTAGSSTCRRVCSLKGSGSTCLSGGGCTPVYGSQNYGYCR
jgi:hypothetical protein